MFTASEYDFPIQFAFNIDQSGAWEAVNSNSPMLTGKTRSQDLSKKYRPNGAIYLLESRSFISNATFYMCAKPFLISKRESIDVDTRLDFKIAEILINEENNKN